MMNNALRIISLAARAVFYFREEDGEQELFSSSIILWDTIAFLCVWEIWSVAGKVNSPATII